jgi:hypothetical protein
MANQLVLIAKNEASLTLVAKEEEFFLDENFNFVGERLKPTKYFSKAMIEIVQSTSFVLTVNLVKPNGQPFDLTGASAIQLGIFQRSPIQETISLTAGSAAGLPIDGIALFNLTSSDTNFEGFAEGAVQVIKPGGTSAFESFQVVYRKNLFLP